jgi:hypothetical protein
MHKKQSYLKGVKCNTMPGEKKGKRAGRKMRITQAEIDMCQYCEKPMSECKGTCVYKGEG